MNFDEPCFIWNTTQETPTHDVRKYVHADITCLMRLTAKLNVLLGRELARSDGAALRGHRGPAALRLPAAPPRRQEGRP